MTIITSRLSSGPRPPPEIDEEVKLWARKSGRDATMHFVPGYGCWFARLSLRCNDKRLLAYQRGEAPEPPTEDIWFHRPVTPEEVKKGAHPVSFVPLDIHQMGVSGVREFLERGDTWSGRGEHRSLEDLRDKTSKHNEVVKEKNRADAREEVVKMAMDTRRTRLKIPFHRVGIDLREEKSDGQIATQD